METAGITDDQLKSIIERIERLEEGKAGIASDIKDAEAKGNGFDTKVNRELTKRRATFDRYMAAIGMRP